MTNIELIKILLRSVEQFGKLPVDMDIEYFDSEKPYNVEDALYDKNSVTLYNY